MKLAIFDIDGTLLNTNRVDSDCFIWAFAEEFSISDFDLDWSKYEYATNSGIVRAIFQRVFHRTPEELEIRRFQSRFLHLLQDVHLSKPKLFLEIRGARRFFNFLVGHLNWKVAIATGGWHEDAAFKLTAAGFSFNSIPISTSDRARDRESILEICIQESCRQYNVDRFSRIVSFGDALWDVAAARALGLGFIGVGDKSDLTKLGVAHVVKDYGDLDRLMELLELASVPKQTEKS